MRLLWPTVNMWTGTRSRRDTIWRGPQTQAWHQRNGINWRSAISISFGLESHGVKLEGNKTKKKLLELKRKDKDKRRREMKEDEGKERGRITYFIIFFFFRWIIHSFPRGVLQVLPRTSPFCARKKLEISKSLWEPYPLFIISLIITSVALSPFVCVCVLERNVEKEPLQKKRQVWTVVSLYVCFLFPFLR